MSLLGKKSFLKSKTMRGIGVVVLSQFVPPLLAKAGVENPTETIQAFGTLVGSALAAYGRIKATQAIG